MEPSQGGGREAAASEEFSRPEPAPVRRRLRVRFATPVEDVVAAGAPESADAAPPADTD
ncbi:hypothetical protein [Marinactinospora rubrisoli]|uniref:Uncharacterized protein n=1 Tax=Marinactinospora rubrisoli TaxID=2715399 RepID=A0ABW2KJ07_9ACTN